MKNNLRLSGNPKQHFLLIISGHIQKKSLKLLKIEALGFNDFDIKMCQPRF